MSTQISRRHVLQMIGLTAVGPLLAACGSTPSAPTAAPKAESKAAAPAAQQAPAQKSGSVTTLTAVMSVGGSGKALQGGVQKFVEANQGKYEVKTEQIAIESLLEKEMAQFISGNPTFDVLSIDSTWLPGVAHFLTPLDSYLERDKIDFAAGYGPRVRRVVSLGDHLIAMPVRFGTDILFYRKDLLDQASVKPPTTYQEFREAARKLTVKDASGKATVFGTSFKAQSPSWTVGSFGHFLLGSGGRFITDDAKGPHPSLNSPLAHELLDNIRAIIQDGSTPEVTAWTYDDNVVAFQQGRVAMSDEYSARSLLVEDKQKSQAVGKMGYRSWIMQKLGPEEPIHYASTWNWGIDKNSRNKDAAWELLKFMVGPEAQKLMALQFANGPTLISVYDDPDYQKVDPAASAIKDVLQGTGWMSYYAVPQAPELEKAAHEEIQAFYVGRQTNKQATENMTRRFAQILKA